MSDDALWDDLPGSVFRPSYAPTWMSCAGSLLPSQTGKDMAGEDAAIGTVFHSIIAEWQEKGRPDYRLGSIERIYKQDGSGDFFDVEVVEEMFIEAERCLDYYAGIPGDRFVETRVDISSITPIPGQGGTADLSVCQPRILDIIDWKYGRGVQVFAEKNYQLALYAWGFFEKFDWIYHFERIRMHIAQPRLNHFEFYEITREQLIEFSEFAKERAHAAWKPNADRSPSPKACQWCKVSVDCPALELVRQELASQSFDMIDEPVTDRLMNTVVLRNSPPSLKPLPDPIRMPTTQLSRILTYRKLMESWFKEIAEELTTRAINGEDLDDLWKIVEGRSRRRWKDETLAAEKLSLLGLAEDEIFVEKLVSPNQSEKLLKLVGIRPKIGKAFLRTLVDRPPGKPTLAPSGDNRLEVPNLIDDTFDTEEDEAAL